MARTKATPADEIIVEDTETPPTATLKVKRLHPDATLPKFAHEGDACFDIHALEDGILYSRGDQFGQGRAFRTGLAFEIPAGYVLNIYSRSGMGFTNAVRLGNSVGVIDQGYRGELKVKLHNDGGSIYEVRKGDRIAQGRLEYIVPTEIVEVDELADSERGVNGGGSTGR